MRRPSSLGGGPDAVSADQIEGRREQLQWRDEVWARSLKAGQYYDQFTTMSHRPYDPAELMRLPKCLARDKDGKIVKREDL